MQRNLRGPGGTRLEIFDPKVKVLNGNARPAPKALYAELLPGTAFEPESVDWLWLNWLARSKFHLIGGSPGTGKTTIALSLAAAITSAGKWPDGSAVREAGDVVMWTGEDGIADTLVPRFMAAGGDRSRIYFVNGMNEGQGKRAFDPACDMEALENSIAAAGLSVKLLILDPVVAVLGKGVDSHKNSETRRGLQPVVDLADKIGCGVLGVTHLAKNSKGRAPLERLVGSLAFGAVARIAMGTVRDADEDKPRRLVRLKNNLGPDTGGFAYTLCSAPVPGRDDLHNQRVDWGEELEGSPLDLMSVEERADDSEGDALAAAEEFLRHLLRDGPITTKDIEAAAKAHTHAWATVRRAKASLGIKVVRGGGAAGDGVWSWQLPDPPKALNGC